MTPIWIRTSKSRNRIGQGRDAKNRDKNDGGKSNEYMNKFFDSFMTNLSNHKTCVWI